MCAKHQLQQLAGADATSFWHTIHASGESIPHHPRLDLIELSAVHVTAYLLRGALQDWNLPDARQAQIGRCAQVLVVVS